MKTKDLDLLGKYCIQNKKDPFIYTCMVCDDLFGSDIYMLSYTTCSDKCKKALLNREIIKKKTHVNLVVKLPNWYKHVYVERVEKCLEIIKVEHVETINYHAGIIYKFDFFEPEDKDNFLYWVQRYNFHKFILE